MTTRSVSVCWICLVVAVLFLGAVIPAAAAEIGGGVSLSTSFSFANYSLAFDVYSRFALGSLLAWELGLGTYTGFDVLTIHNTLATLSALHLALGHVTYLLPVGSLGSTYFTAGLGWTLGRALLSRISASLAFSLSPGSIYTFLLFRIQIGLAGL